MLESKLEVPELNEFASTMESHQWNDIATDRLVAYRKLCVDRAVKHSKAHHKRQMQYKGLQIPILVLSGFIALLSSLNTCNGDFAIPIAVLTAINGIALSIGSFLEYGKKASRHQEVSNDYKRLLRSIDMTLFLVPEERDSPKYTFEVVSKELDMIAQDEPSLAPSQSPEVSESKH